MAFVGWDPERVRLLRRAGNEYRSLLLGAAVRLHRDDEPSIDELATTLRRHAAEWERDLLPLLDRLHGDTTAGLVAHSLSTWLLEQAASIHSVPGPNPADRWFRQLTADRSDPWPAAALLLRAVDDPALLFDTAADPRLAGEVVSLGLPALSAAEAERVIVAFIEWFRSYELAHHPLDETFNPEWRELLVDLVAPHLLRFSPLDRTWITPPRRRAELLDMLLTDEVMLGMIIERTPVTARHAAVELARLDQSEAAEQLAAYLGMLGALVTWRLVDDEQLRGGQWFLLWTAAQSLGAAVGGTVGGGVTAAVGAKAGVVVLQHVAGNWAPDPQRVIVDEQYANRWTLAVAAAAMAIALVDDWRSSGLVTIHLPPPPVPHADDEDPVSGFLQRFRSWRAALPGGADGALADRASRLVFTLVAPSAAGVEVADAIGR